MTTAIAGLLALLALTALTVQVNGLNGYIDHTYINNLSSKKIRASVHYYFSYGHSKFIDRVVDPGTHAADQYNNPDCVLYPYLKWPIGVVIIVEPEACETEIFMNCDQSVVVLDNSYAHGVDIYASQYGDINKPVSLLHSLRCT